METKIKIGLLLVVVLLSAWAIAAKPTFVETENPAGKIVEIPEYAIEVAPGVFKLGSAVHNGELVEGYAFVDYKEAPGKPSGCNLDGKCQGWEDTSCEDCAGGGGEEPPESSCYGFLAKATKWKTVEPYVVNPVNAHGLDEATIVANFASDIEKWETAAGLEIVGPGSSTTAPLFVDTVQPDNVNEVYFGSIADNNAIAITVVWGIFSGAPKNRKLVEWDQVYDEADYGWSLSGEAGKMDFENIATHELGHTVGLDDLYTTGCSQETMYGYAGFGETNKRTLEAGDITGVKELYK